VAGATEPAQAMVSYEEKTEPLGWARFDLGQSHSTTALQFDDLAAAAGWGGKIDAARIRKGAKAIIHCARAHGLVRAIHCANDGWSLGDFGPGCAGDQRGGGIHGVTGPVGSPSKDDDCSQRRTCRWWGRRRCG